MQAGLSQKSLPFSESVSFRSSLGFEKKVMAVGCYKQKTTVNKELVKDTKWSTGNKKS